MKPQDILFLIVFLVLLLMRREGRIFALVGLSCILLSIPLFALRVFFTAQHLIYYSFTFLLFGTILLTLKKQ